MAIAASDKWVAVRALFEAFGVDAAMLAAATGGYDGMAGVGPVRRTAMRRLRCAGP
jgi:hypothetical protein